MNIDDLINEILDHPEAPRMAEQINSALKKEKNARVKFREWLKDNVKAEFINGEIVMHSPVKRGHLNVNSFLTHLLQTHASLYDLGEVSSEKALIGLTRNDYEPDICFWNKERTSDFDDNTMVHPAPDFIVEILSKSTERYDRGIKFDDYAKHGVQEYWLVSYMKKTIEKFTLIKENYVLDKLYKSDEVIESQVLRGFKIPVAAIFERAIYLKENEKQYVERRKKK